LTVYLVKSTDDGRTFSAPRRVNDGPTGPECRFPTVAVDSRGTVHVAWLDKRHETPERPGFSRVYVARSTDGGRTFQRNVDATGKQECSICHCCRMGVATHPEGGIVVLFRNDVNDLRDIFLVRSQDGGEWSAPEPIEETRWILPSCPMNGPSVALDEAGNLHAVWSTGGPIHAKPVFPGEESAMRVMYRRLNARSQNWEAPIYLGSGSYPRIVLGPDGTPLVTWKGDQIMVARLPAEGRGAPAALALSRASSTSSYPTLSIAAGGELLVAWQQREGENPSQLHLARVLTGSAGVSSERPAPTRR
jgi:hypothetical protein